MESPAAVHVDERLFVWANKRARGGTAKTCVGHAGLDVAKCQSSELLEFAYLTNFKDDDIRRFGPEVTEIRPIDLSTDKGVRKVLVLSASKGMGKSKAIRSAITKCGAGNTVLNVTFRRSLARGAAAELPGGSVYLDEPVDVSFTADTHPVLTILVNSLMRVRDLDKHPYKILILDEWVSILEMLGADIIDGRQRFLIIRILCELFAAARAVVVSDALLDQESLVILRNLLDASSEVATEVTLLNYEHKNHAEYTYVSYSSIAAWSAKLLASVVEHKRRIVVPCMTKAFALRLDAQIRAIAPDLRILTYVAGSEHDMVQHMAEINRVWSEVDVLIYSPVITAGCSFEVRGHFDECFLYAYQGTASVRSALQMTFRVRDLTHKTIHVYINRAGHWVDGFACPTYPALVPTTPIVGWFVHDAILALHHAREFDRTHCFMSSFWKLAAQSGVKLVSADGSVGGEAVDRAIQERIEANNAHTRQVVTTHNLKLKPRPLSSTDLLRARSVEWLEDRWHCEKQEEITGLFAGIPFSPHEVQHLWTVALHEALARQSTPLHSGIPLEITSSARIVASRVRHIWQQWQAAEWLPTAQAFGMINRGKINNNELYDDMLRLPLLRVEGSAVEGSDAEDATRNRFVFVCCTERLGIDELARMLPGAMYSVAVWLTFGGTVERANVCLEFSSLDRATVFTRKLTIDPMLVLATFEGASQRTPLRFGSIEHAGDEFIWQGCLRSVGFAVLKAPSLAQLCALLNGEAEGSQGIDSLLLDAIACTGGLGRDILRLLNTKSISIFDPQEHVRLFEPAYKGNCRDITVLDHRRYRMTRCLPHMPNTPSVNLVASMYANDYACLASGDVVPTCPLLSVQDVVGLGTG